MKLLRASENIVENHGSDVIKLIKQSGSVGEIAKSIREYMNENIDGDWLLVIVNSGIAVVQLASGGDSVVIDRGYPTARMNVGNRFKPVLETFSVLDSHEWSSCMTRKAKAYMSEFIYELLVGNIDTKKTINKLLYSDIYGYHEAADLLEEAVVGPSFKLISPLEYSEMLVIHE